MKRNIFFAATLVFILLLTGCQSDNRQTKPIQDPTPSLELSYQYNPNYIRSFKEADLGDLSSATLEYFRVTDVKITANGTVLPLEDALRDGVVTFHEIHCLAQKDAHAGICYESAKSKRGLTQFSYDYLSFKLIITDDIYETPDGKQHLIRNLTVTDTGSDPMLLLQHLDQEDWGIEFEVADVTPSSITLNYTQSGGQLIGQMRTGNYELSRTDSVKAVHRLDDMLMPESFWIAHNTQGQITLNLETLFGILESGDYYLYLYLHDDYDPESAPPLIRNYHDIQCYGIEFSIP